MARLLHVSANTYPPLNQEHSTKRIWRELAKGFETYHILGRANDNKFHSYCEGNIYLHLVPKIFHTWSFLFTSFLMSSIIKKHQIDILLCQCPIFGGFTAAILGKWYKVPYVQEVHDTYYFDFLKSTNVLHILLSKVYLYVIKNARKVRALNEMMKAMILKYTPQADVRVVENRVDFKIFNFQKTDFSLRKTIHITSIGTFVFRKGYHIAIEAIKRLSEQYDIKLTLVGGGEDREKLRRLAGEYKNITLYDRIPQEQLSRILADTDIYIQPSLREGMPRTVLEAMAMRLPIIATNVSTIPGVITDHVNGLLIAPSSVDELVEAINMLIIDNALREKIACQGYKDAVQNYEWNKVFQKYRALLLDAI